jgi:hypothetical protein
LAAVSPVSRASPGPWSTVAGSGAFAGACGAAGVVVVVPDPDDEPPVAAPARPATPTEMPTAAAAVAIHVGARFDRCMCSLLRLLGALQEGTRSIGAASKSNVRSA